MDSSADSPTAIDCQEYRCPGERYTIDRSTHLGRLSNFYAKCHTCLHREDTATLSKKVVKCLDESRRRAAVPPMFEGDALQGDVGQSLTVDVARSVARAFGIWLRRRASDDGAPKVILAGDGRPLTAELVAALGQGLAWAGCCVIDVGHVIAPAAVDAQARLDAGGTIAVGNAPGKPQTASMRLFGPGGCPLSVDDGLQQIETMLVATLDRPSRHAPPPERLTADRSYLDRLQGYFHALRPLRFVMDTPSPIVIDWTAELLSQVECSAILLRGGSRYVGAYDKGTESPWISGNPLPTDARFSGRSLDVQRSPWNHSGRSHDVPRAVKEASAHFGVTIDGDGQTLNLWDETGRKISAEALFVMLATLGIEDQRGATVVAHDQCPAKFVETIRSHEIEVVTTPATTSDLQRTMIECDAVLGLGSHGQLWHRNNVPMADALQTLARVLAALSHSDRPLSDVIRQLVQCGPRPAKIRFNAA